MVAWNNFDTLKSYQELKENTKKVRLATVMSGDNGASRVKNYSIPMGAGLVYNYAAKEVDEDIISTLAALAEEAQLTEKYAELYNGEVALAQRYAREGRVLIISPDDTCGVDTLTRDLDRLKQLYGKGLHDAQRIADFMKQS